MGINMLMDTATGWLLYELVEVNDQKKLFLSNYIHMLNNRTAFTKYYNHPLGHLFCPWSSIINEIRGVKEVCDGPGIGGNRVAEYKRRSGTD